MIRAPRRLSWLTALIALPLLAACEDVVQVWREDPLVRDIAEDGELTVYRRTF